MIKQLKKNKRIAQEKSIPEVKKNGGEFVDEKESGEESIPEHGKPLTPKQELFCRCYATEREFFGNGLQSYAMAYNIDLSKSEGVNTAKSNAYKLLTNTYITDRIAELLELGGLTDERVDKELLFLITQHEDKFAKLGAIKEYNSLKARIKKQVELTGKDGKPLFVATPESLMPEYVRLQIQQGIDRGTKEESLES